MHHLEQIALRKPITRPGSAQKNYTIRDGKKVDRHGLPYQNDQEDTQTQALIKNIKKNQKRINKAKKLIKGPETEKNALLYADTRVRILRWEQVISRNLAALARRNAEKQRQDKREQTKFENRQKEDRNEIVRLSGKIVPKKEENSFSHFNDLSRPIRESLSNRNGLSPHEMKIRRENEKIERFERRKKFLADLEKPEPKKRQKSLSTEKKRPPRNYSAGKGYSKTYYP